MTIKSEKIMHPKVFLFITQATLIISSLQAAPAWNSTAFSVFVLQHVLAAGSSIYSGDAPDKYPTANCNRKTLYSTAACPKCNACVPQNRRTSNRSDSDPAPPNAMVPTAAPVPSPNPAPAPEGQHQGSHKAGSSLSPLPFIVGVTLGIIVIIIITIIILYSLKRRRSPSGPNKKSIQDVENVLLQHGSLVPKRYKYSDIKKITKSLTDKLGQGGCGSVYKGMLPDGRFVAVKVLTETDSNGEEFINEVISISKTSHVNIVSLLGFCYDGNKRALVYEFMPNKSLDKFINDGGLAHADCRLDIDKLYNIAVGVAKGLEYLHTGCNTRIVHFDIKPQNILLDEDFCPKISDFGLAKLCKKKQSIISMLGGRGTVGYIAPEVFLRNFGGVSHKSDVYSYGMMILEVIGARKIEETEAVQSSENYFPDKIYDLVVVEASKKLGDLVIEDEEERIRKMFLAGFWCIQTNPSNRPSMSKVVEMLEGSFHSIDIPPKPILFCPSTLSGREISSPLQAHVETENSGQVIVKT